MSKPKYRCPRCGKRTAVRRDAFGCPYPIRHYPPNGGLCHGHMDDAEEIPNPSQSTEAGQ